MKVYVKAFKENRTSGKKVYVVIAGTYTDYYPVGVYSTRQRAQEVVEREQQTPGVDAYIEEYELDAYDK